MNNNTPASIFVVLVAARRELWKYLSRGSQTVQAELGEGVQKPVHTIFLQRELQNLCKLELSFSIFQ